MYFAAFVIMVLCLAVTYPPLKLAEMYDKRKQPVNKERFYIMLPWGYYSIDATNENFKNNKKIWRKFIEFADEYVFEAQQTYKDKDELLEALRRIRQEVCLAIEKGLKKISDSNLQWALIDYPEEEYLAYKPKKTLRKKIAEENVISLEDEEEYL